MATQKGEEIQKRSDVIEGWEAIADFAGYSVKTVKNYEKQGLPVHRRYRGKSIRVWAYASEVREFVDAHMEAKTLDPEKLPPIKTTLIRDKRSLLILWWLGGLAITFLVLFFLILLEPQKAKILDGNLPRDIGFYQWIENQVDRPHRLDLFDTRGEKIRTLWRVPNGWDEREFLRFKIDSCGANIAIRKGGEDRPTVLLESLGKGTFIHTAEKKTPLKIPNLSIQTLEPRWLEMTRNIAGCFRIESPTFRGWGLFAQNDSLFPSCLLILDEEFHERARLYHPGRLKYGISRDQYLVVSGTLNARPSDEDLYRASLFRLSIPAILGCHCQIMPFSAKTIPNLKRRNYYRFKDLPKCLVDTYLALAPNLRYEFQLHTSGSHLGFGSSLDNKERINLIFTWDLTFVEKRVVDHEYKGNYEEDYFKTRFQYWRKDEWGPWLATHPP